MKKIIKKILKIKVFKVILCLLENIIKLISLKFRLLIENKLFNPYDFWEKNRENYLNQVKLIDDFVEKYNLKYSELSMLELGPGGFLWVPLFLKSKWLQSYYTIDEINHFEYLDGKAISLYNKVDDTFLKNNWIDQNYVHVLSYSALDIQQLESSIDFVFSNAVYEHIHDVEESIKQMSMVTKSWWYWLHTIDFRDHIFDKKSLFFLTIPQWLFKFLFGKCWAYVNRLRYSQIKDLFEKYWFKIMDNLQLELFDDKQIKKYPNLKKCYKHVDLTVAVARFIVKKV